MQVGKDYQVEQDGANTIVSKKRITRATGEVQWDAEAYFSSTLIGLKNAIKYIADQGVAQTRLADLRIVTAKQDDIYRLIENTVHAGILTTE